MTVTQPSLASAGSYFLHSPPVLTRDHVSINSLQVNLCVRVHVPGTVVSDRPSHYSDFVSSSSSSHFLILPLLLFLNPPAAHTDWECSTPRLAGKQSQGG